ncbi:MAG: hypothetical protein EON59_07745 [Alphaproteobacteria bacterium]|nr:MAG: hypothetical protein EON59_07745 [Alphaproteobacteria bacterium]
MFVQRVRLSNFSSWEDSSWIELAPDLNLFIGLNNSGKSALLRSFLHPLPNNPHKDSEQFRAGDLKIPRVEFTLSITPEELYQRFSRLNKSPTFPAGSRDNSSIGTAILETALNDSKSILKVECFRTPGDDLQPMNGGSVPDLRSQNSQITMNVEWQDGRYKSVSRAADPDNLPTIFQDERAEGLFYFSPQRLNIARSGMSEQTRLTPDASNLPAVLAYVQGARAPLFQEIESHVIDIMAGVERITVVPRGSNFEILVWPVRDTIHLELAFSLEDSGTGVGQLLAILTAVVLSEQSVIVIDEINTFLHATAVKRLINLLKTVYSRHQYVISSHSAEVIGNTNPSKLYHVTRKGYKSAIERLNLADVQQAREIAGHFGFSMLDVFGFERVIWVEGPTEELIFPMILEHDGASSSSELGFCAVASTSAFSSRGGNRTQVLEIYDNAGRRLSPLLKGMAFGLDREGMDDASVKALQRSRRKLRFLPRRCIENYLLKPPAISSVLESLGEFVTEEQVSAVLTELGSRQEFMAPNAWNGDLNAEPWLIRVDGAKLLGRVFSVLSENRMEFRKTRDSVLLAKYLIENSEPDLASLSQFVTDLREIALRDTAP